MNKIEFEKFVKKIGMFLTTQELTTVFKTFDNDNDRQIRLKEFIETLRVSNDPSDLVNIGGLPREEIGCCEACIPVLGCGGYWTALS